jgi:hypothetical protein
MKPVMQTNLTRLGNCFEACLASILECDIDVFPGYKNINWWSNYQEWFCHRGIAMLGILWKDMMVLEHMPRVYSIVSGKSPRYKDVEPPVLHATVWFGNKMVHDPYPGGGGLLTTEDCIYLIPSFPKMVPTICEEQRS